MSNLAIIPARSGSKRIPKKNIKHFHGKPIIAYSIKAALNSGFFDEVMVSTDDTNIAELAIDLGAKVPFIRSEKNADDHAVLSDVVDEVLENYKQIGHSFDYVCCLLPTAPFISIETLNKAFSKLQNERLDSVFPVLEFSFPIQRALKMDVNRIEMVNEKYLNMRSQDLSPRYHDAGQFYWCSVEAFLINKKLYTSNSGAIVISHLEAQDIDTDIDWKLAELKYTLLHDLSE